MPAKILVPAALLLALLPTGCSKEGQQPGEVKNLQNLAALYGRYKTKNQGVSPPDEATFRQFIVGLYPQELQAMNVDPNNLDVLFTSPRDQQKYVVIYVPKSRKPAADSPVFAYEKVGVNGKRMVARSTTQVEEMDLAELQKLVPNAE